METQGLTLICSDLVIRTGRRELLSRFSWRHSPGGIAWLFGSNGSGKSSLLRVLAGLAKPTSGNVAWQDAEGHRVAYHAPSMHVPPEIRIRDFVTLTESLTKSSAPPSLIDSLFPSTIDGDDAFRTLSTGEAKRLMLWAMLRGGRGRFVLDEPYEHLSRDAKETLSALLRWVAARSNVVVATNQDVPVYSADVMLTFEGSVIEVQNVV
jgi:ABC-type transport system involved in cytochrome c biogenesis ATPase subunit